MAEPLQTIKGTKDILPADVARWRRVEDVARALMARYRYQEIRTPIYEATELFARGIGENTDIVGKEMFSFDDRGGRHVTLRPENTAGVVRAYVQHKLYVEPAPQKLWYVGPMFRAENVQAGRQRQFHQIGVECLATEDPRYDAECIVLAHALVGALGVPNLEIQLNSVGCAGCRGQYRDTLQAYLRGVAADMCGDCQTRTEKNPLRVLDCKVPKCQPIIEAAPPLDAALCEACRDALAQVTGLLDAVGVPWVRNPRLVRGLDYYSRTVFELVTREKTALGNQSTVCAGGRYNDLVAELGGPATAAVGWGLGMERLLTLMPADDAGAAPPAAVVMVGPGAPVGPGLVLAQRLRAAGLCVELAPGGKLDKQFKFAERLGAHYAFILGESEIAEGVATVKHLADRAQSKVGLDDAALSAWLSASGFDAARPLSARGQGAERPNKEHA